MDVKILVLLILPFAFAYCETGTESQISQYGITWTFDQEYECGQFANGDYWVVGPATITSITPDWTGTLNGWMVNPSTQQHSFDSRAAGFNSQLMPELPYTANPGESIIKAISIPDAPSSSEGCRPCLSDAAVLTILDSVPPDNGASVFRPAYYGDDKSLISVTNIDSSKLPSLAPVNNMPTLESVENSFKRLQLDYLSAWTSRAIHPSNNMATYGGSIAIKTNEAALRFMIDDSFQAKKSALINYLQYGIDLYPVFKSGVLFSKAGSGGGGHTHGRKLPLTFASLILGDTDMQDFVKNAGDSVFQEHNQVQVGTNGTPLFGIPINEESYWKRIAISSGSRTIMDPYGFIDGGDVPGTAYQYLTINSYKGMTTAVLLMDGLRDIWNDETFIDYTDRWVTQGTWASPDPCAPFDGVWPDNYGITYGPDSNGGCILDTDLVAGSTMQDFSCQPGRECGRFESRHGESVDGGSYRSAFADNLWETYRHHGQETCLELGGNTCSAEQVCEGGSFQTASDSEHCCVNGICSEPQDAFFDDFNGANVDTSKWTVASWSEHGGQTGPARCYVENGNLVMKFINDDGTFLSSAIQTKEQFLYGKWEARLKVSSVPGVLNSFYTIDWDDENQDGSSDGSKEEIDIEFLTYTFANNPSVHFAVHEAGSPSFGTNPDIALSFDPSDDYHVWGFDITTEYVEWFVDDNVLLRYDYDEITIDSTYMLKLNTRSQEHWINGPPEPGIETIYLIDWIRFTPANSAQTCHSGADSGNAVVELNELISHINNWKNGHIAINNLVMAIKEWKEGC